MWSLPSTKMLALSYPQAIVSLVVDSASGVATALGVRGLPPESSPRGAEYVPENGEDSSSFVVSLDIEDGEKRTGLLFQVLDFMSCQAFYFPDPRQLHLLHV